MNRVLLHDVLERAGWTAAQAFLSTWAITSIADVTDRQLLLNAAVAALAAGLSVLKGVVASRIGEPTASLP